MPLVENEGRVFPLTCAKEHISGLLNPDSICKKRSQRVSEMIFVFLLLLRLFPGSFGGEHFLVETEDDDLAKGSDMKYSPLETKLVKEDPFDSQPASASHCSGKGKKSKDCCFMCDNCKHCKHCALCGDSKHEHLISKEGCKFCPLCAKDCVQSGYCGKVCKVDNLPEAGPGQDYIG